MITKKDYVNEWSLLKGKNDVNDIDGTTKANRPSTKDRSIESNDTQEKTPHTHTHMNLNSDVVR